MEPKNASRPSKMASKAQYPDSLHPIHADDKEIFKFDGQDSQEENSDDDFDDSLTGIDKKLVGMCPEVTEQLIRQMGVTGGGLDMLDSTVDLHGKERFWSTLLSDLSVYGEVGCTTTKQLKARWTTLCTKFKKAKKKNNQSGAECAKFQYYDLMAAEVGHRPRFTASALVDTSQSASVVSLKVEKGEVKAEKNMKPPNKQPSSSNNEVLDVTSDDKNGIRRKRATYHERHLSEQRKARHFLETTTKARDENMATFMENLLTQGEEIKQVMRDAVTEQKKFNDDFFSYLRNK